MPRTVSATIQAAIGQTITEPNYLVELGFSPIVRWAALRDVTWGGFTWSANGLMVQTVSTERAQISMRNSDNSISALVLGNALKNISCKVYQHYDSDAELLFAGVLSGSPEVGTRVILDALSEGRDRKYPDQQIVPPLFNHLMPVGTEIDFGGKMLRLEEAR